MNTVNKPEVKTRNALDIKNPNSIPHLLEEGEIGAILEWEVRDSKTGLLNILPDGKPNQGQRKAESFLRQFMDLFYVMACGMYGLTSYKVTNNANIPQGVDASAWTFACNALANDATFGIIVGTGNAAPTINDYVIQTLIAHGAGAGQLQYGIVTYGAPASDATTSQFTITRNFANASGAPITVNEIGLYVKGYGYGTISGYFMTLRDVIGGGIAVPNGQTLTINYRPQVVV